MAQTANPETPAADPDKALGRWVSKAGDSQTEIFKSGGTYSGRLLAGWGNALYEPDGTTPRLDTRNPNPALRTQPLRNAVILSDLKYEHGEYQHGTYYDPRSGRTFGCIMRLRGETLEIRIFVKFKLLGVTKTWTRIPG